MHDYDDVESDAPAPTKEARTEYADLASVNKNTYYPLSDNVRALNRFFSYPRSGRRPFNSISASTTFDQISRHRQAKHAIPLFQRLGIIGDDGQIDEAKIKEWQKKLVEFGAYGDTPRDEVDGKFGPRTWAALNRYAADPANRDEMNQISGLGADQGPTDGGATTRPVNCYRDSRLLPVRPEASGGATARSIDRDHDPTRLLPP